MNNDTPADAITLLPCPFCGSEPCEDPQNGYVPIAGTQEFKRGIHCFTCGNQGPERNTDAEAITAWNTRTTSLAAQDGLVERVARAICQSTETDVFDELPEGSIYRAVYIQQAKAALASIEVKS